MEQVRDDFQTQGYKVKTEGERTTLMEKHSYGSVGGHLVVALFTIWWTFGIGNAIYALWAYVTGSESVLLRIDEQEVAPAPALAAAAV